MVITKKLIEDRLRQVMDPELGINIMDLGLIYEIKLTKNKKRKTKNDHHPSSIIHHPLVNILMTLTTPGCPLAAVFMPMMRQALVEIPGFDPYKDLEVEITFDPPWHQGMMSERAKAEMGFES